MSDRQFTFQDFLAWERASRDTIDVKRAYIDMAGDLEAGVMLSQIIWHLACARHDRRRVVKDNAVWLVIEREEWWRECRIAPRSADRLLGKLRDRELIATKKFRVQGSPRIHIRIQEKGFLDAWMQVTAEGSESRPPPPPGVLDRTDLTDSLFGIGHSGAAEPPPTGADKPPELTEPSIQNSPNGKFRINETVNSELTKPLIQNSPNREFISTRESARESVRDNNNREEAADAAEARERKAVVVALLVASDVWEGRAVELAEAGLTKAAAQREIAALAARNVKTNRGGLLYAACKAALTQPWPEPQAGEKPTPKPKLQVKGAGQPTGALPPRNRQTEAEDAEAARAWAEEQLLDPAGRVRLEAEARERLPAIHRGRFDARRAEGKGLPPDVAALWEAAKREVLALWRAQDAQKGEAAGA